MCLTIGAEFTGTVEQKVCFPACETDADCLRGEHVMRCGSGSCQFIQCLDDDQCPGGAACVGAVCIEDDEGYGIHSGYCQRKA